MMPMIHQSLASVLLSGYRRRVFGLLLLHPDEALHGREIARRTGLPAGTLTRELRLWAEVGLLVCKRQGNQRLYSANRDSPIEQERLGRTPRHARICTPLPPELHHPVELPGEEL